MTYAEHDRRSAERRASDQAAIAVQRHRNRLNAERAEKNFYLGMTAIFIFIAVVILWACAARAAENEQLRQTNAALRAQEVDARLALYAFLSHCKHVHEDQQAAALGRWIAGSVRERGKRLSTAIPSYPPCCSNPSAESGWSSGAAADTPAVAAPPFDFSMRDFIAAHILKVNGRRTVEEAEMLADACMCLPGNDPLRWAATMQAESTFNLTARNYCGCYGVFQINEPVHRRRLRQLGLDIYDSFDAQAAFAGLLWLDNESWGPWRASRSNTNKYLRGLRREWEAESNVE